MPEDTIPTWIFDMAQEMWSKQADEMLQAQRDHFEMLKHQNTRTWANTILMLAKIKEILQYGGKQAAIDAIDASIAQIRKIDQEADDDC